MARCATCSHVKHREINRRLLLGEQAQLVGADFGIKAHTLRYHRRWHLPWRNANAKKPETVQEKLQELEYELHRLQVLGECGEKIGPAIQAATARRNLFELEARMGNLLGATHMKLFPAKTELDQDMEVIFENGRPRTVTASEARRLREEQEPRQ
jgi:hypothetical protein